LPREADTAGRVERDVRAFVRRVLRYGGVGLAISLFYSFAVIAGVRLSPSVSPTLASALAFLLVLPVSYLAHGRITFADRGNDPFQPLRFVVSTAASFVIAVGGMYWITEIAGHSYLLGVAWNWLIIPALNFFANLLWVFRNIRNGAGRGEANMASMRR
jgi:putative flippase GtrA